MFENKFVRVNCLHIHLKDGFELVDNYPKTSENDHDDTDYVYSYSGCLGVT
jgi:hypothetical protein